MKTDINNIITNLNTEWANHLAGANKNVALLQEENRVLREKIKELEKEDAE